MPLALNVIQKKFCVLQKKVLSFGPNRTVEVRPNSSAEPNVRLITTPKDKIKILIAIVPENSRSYTRYVPTYVFQLKFDLFMCEKTCIIIQWHSIFIRTVSSYTANIYRMVIGNFICNPLSTYRILPIGTNTYR